MAHSSQGKGGFLEDEKIARIKLDRPIHVPDRIVPARLSSIDHAEIEIKSRRVRQTFSGQLELGQRLVVIAKTVVGIDTFLQVHFARIRLDALRLLQSLVGFFRAD